MINEFNKLGTAMESSTEDDCFNNAICEYTLLNIDKAFKVNNYDRSTVRSLAKKYASGDI